MLPVINSILSLVEITAFTLRCQINEYTRLAFLDFFPTLLVNLALLVLIFHPTRLANFPLHSIIWPYFFYDIYDLLKISTLHVYLALCTRLIGT